jgi:hypothetical protein
MSRPKPNSSRSRAIKKRAKRRAYERLDGFQLSMNKHKELVKLIQANKLEFVERQSNRVTVWKYEDYKVVYDSFRKLIITFLPGEQDGC